MAGGPPLAVPPPCPGVTQREALGSSFEDQPMRRSRWPGWGPPRPGFGPVGVSWQGSLVLPLALGPPNPKSQALAGRLWPQDRQENQVQALLPQEVGLPPAPSLPSVGPKQEVGGLGSRGQAWL